MGGQMGGMGISLSMLDKSGIRQAQPQLQGPQGLPGLGGAGPHGPHGPGLQGPPGTHVPVTW